VLILRFHFPRKFFRKSSSIPIFLLFIFSFFISLHSPHPLSSAFLFLFFPFSIFHSVLTFSFLLYLPYFLILLQFYKLYLFPISNSFSTFHFLHIVLKSIFFSFFYTFLDMFGEMDREEGGGSVFNGFGYFKEKYFITVLLNFGIFSI